LGIVVSTGSGHGDSLYQSTLVPRGSFAFTIMTDSPPSPAGPTEPPLQFSVGAVLIAQAVCALFLGLLMVLGAFAVLAAFVVTVIYARKRVAEKHLALKRAIYDVLWGIVFPVACLAYDPLVFAPNGQFFDRDETVLIYCHLLWQMAVLLVWLLAGRRLPTLDRWFAGNMLFGAFTAFLLGVCLLPWALIGLLVVGIGVLGLVPFATAFVFVRSAGTAARRAEAATGITRPIWPIFAGFMLASVVPILWNAAFGSAIARLISLRPSGQLGLPLF